MAQRRRFTSEFKRQAVQLLNAGHRRAAELASELGVPHNRLYKWQKARSATSLKKPSALRGSPHEVRVHSDSRPHPSCHTSRCGAWSEPHWVLCLARLAPRVRGLWKITDCCTSSVSSIRRCGKSRAQSNFGEKPRVGGCTAGGCPAP